MKANTVARIVSFSQDAPRSTVARGPVTFRSPAMAFEREPRRQSLTTRELEVLALLCEGMPNKTIQRGLGIGAGTVKCHVGSILGKLGVASRLQAVVAAHRLGLLEGAVAQAKDDDESPCARKDAGPPVWLHRRIDGPLTAAA